MRRRRSRTLLDMLVELLLFLLRRTELQPMLQLDRATGGHRFATGFARAEQALQLLNGLVLDVGRDESVVGQIAHVHHKISVQVLFEQLAALQGDEHFAGQRYLDVTDIPMGDLLNSWYIIILT